MGIGLGAAGLFAGHRLMNEGARRLLLRLGLVYTRDEFYRLTELNHLSYWLKAKRIVVG
jgi:hypothetical protein